MMRNYIEELKGRDKAWLSLLVLFLFCELTVSSQSETTPTPNRRPNIVLVFIDDMGWADFSCFGNRRTKTANIDRLASEGLAFEQFYVNSPICSPSRTAISTGQYPQRWHISSYLDNRKANIKRGMANWLDPKAPMLARKLKEQGGYATGHFGKWHMGGQRDVGDAPLIRDYGFEESLTNFEGLGPRVLPLKYVPGEKEPRRHALGSDRLGHGPISWKDRSLITQEFTEAAIRFIDKAQRDNRPFYVNLWPDDVHSPFHPPLDRWSRATEASKRKRDNYYAVLRTMDEQLGKLFDRIRNDQSLAKNTLILICSDNGHEPGCGSAGELRGAKVTLYEGGIRSPLVVWGPAWIDQSAKGERNRQSIFSAIDLVPSLLDFAGVSNETDNEKLDGENVLSTLLGNSKQGRSQPLFFRRPPDRKRWKGMKDLPDLAMRKGPFKLLCEYDGTKPQFFNIFADAAESKNLSGDAKHKERIEAMTQELLNWHRSMPPDNGANWN